MSRPSGPVVLGIDFGTSNTVAALHLPGRSPRVISLDEQGWLPSAVFLTDDGLLAVGRDAERRARLAPERFEANPKRRIDDADILLGTTAVPVTEAIAAVLRRVREETQRQLAGRAPDLVTITHPARWGSTRKAIITAAARRAGLGRVTLLAEPVAAAVYFASLQNSPAQGCALAVYDLGGGTFDCAVVTIRDGKYSVAAEDGLPDVGGVDFDQALLDHLGRTVSSTAPGRWRDLLRPVTSADRRAARAVHEDVRTAKETLSRYPQADIPMPEPFDDALLSRTEFEGLIRPMVTRTVEVLAATVSRSGYQPQTLAGIYLVGGSSRIPLVGKEISDRIGVVPTTLDQPETAVALGAALWSSARDTMGVDSGSGPVSSGPRSGPSMAPSFRSAAGFTPVGPAGVAGPAGPARAAGPGHFGPGNAASAGSPGPSQPNTGLRQTRIGPPAGPYLPAERNNSFPVGGNPQPRRQRGVLIAAVVAVLAIIGTVTGIVIANSGDDVADPTRPPVSTALTPNSVLTPSSSRVPATPEKRPDGCDDKQDANGLTACLRFAGGALAGDDCTGDLTKLGMPSERASSYATAYSKYGTWTACPSMDRAYLSVLFQASTATNRDALVAFYLKDLKAQSCGTYQPAGEHSGRGTFAAGPYSAEDQRSTLVWYDPNLPIAGLLVPSSGDSTTSPKDLVSFFITSSGFDPSYDNNLCSHPGPQTSTATTTNSTTKTTPPDGDCATTPLDGDQLTPCMAEVFGDAAQDGTCLSGSGFRDQFKEMGLNPTGIGACTFDTDGISITVLLLQFGTKGEADQTFSLLSTSDNATDPKSWDQGGTSGKTFGSVSDNGNETLVWTYDDVPVIGYARVGNESKDESKAASVLTSYWKSHLLPQ